AQADPAAIAEKVQAGQGLDIAGVMLDPADVAVQPKTPQGWAGLADRGTQILLDCRITEPLALEGMAREVVRHVQQARKDAGLEMEDRIILHLHTDSPKLVKAIDLHRGSIAAETLVKEWATAPLGTGAYRV